jgi:hypothetical protein
MSEDSPSSTNFFSRVDYDLDSPILKTIPDTILGLGSLLSPSKTQEQILLYLTTGANIIPAGPQSSHQTTNTTINISTAPTPISLLQNPSNPAPFNPKNPSPLTPAETSIVFEKCFSIYLKFDNKNRALIALKKLLGQVSLSNFCAAVKGLTYKILEEVNRNVH